jgi:DNA invertase Pin-like site-specific DNA recombinase
MKRAAIYVRVSKAYKRDGEERVTIEEQLADCEAYCQEHGYAIVARYVDKDKYRVRGKLVNPSAARKDRPQYKRMLKAAHAGEFDVIVAWKEDRLYRGMYAAMPLAQALDERRNDLMVELVRETFDRSMLEIKAAMGKIELENIRERMIMGRRARLKRGEVPGGTVRYGYQKDENNQLVVDDAEAEVVRRAFEWYTEGENNMEIRRRLNAGDIPPRNSKLWSKATIQNILTFEGYATGEYTTDLDGESFTIPCPPIISMATWRKAQETREGNKLYRGRNVKEDYLCRGMITCPCGWRWNARSHFDRKRGYRWADYYCSRKGHQPELVHPDCPDTIGAKKLDDYVWQFVVTICENPAIVQQAIDARIAQLRAEQGDIEAEAHGLQRELDRITEERQWIITQARKGRITEEDMEMQLVALDFQALNLRTKRDDKIAAIAVQQQAEHLKAWADQYLADIGRGLQALNSDVTELDEKERASLYSTLEAGRFAEKFDGDRIEALRWAVLEEKRRTVRMLVSEILVVKGENGEKLIIPQLALEIPREYASLAYDDQSLEYIESLVELVPA